MSAELIAQSALAAFDKVVSAAGDFRSRPGQRLMAERVAQTFSEASLGKMENDSDVPLRAIAVIQAGTGVGKSLAYCAPAIAVALARKTRVLISTATVALQEQLVTKDLPALAALMDEPFRFGLAKGRGRYVCKLKLARLAGEGGADDDDLFADELAAAGAPFVRHDEEARMLQYLSLARELASSAWDGDRDNLAQQPDADIWQPIAAEASSCTGKHCPAFNGCTYFEKRKELVGAQVIVANHDLLLSTLGTRTLPELDNCLLILDEGHHLPAVALDKFSTSMDLSRLGWIDTLASRAKRIGSLMAVSEVADVGRYASQLKQSLDEVAKIVAELYAPALRDQPANAYGPPRVRLPKGDLPLPLVEPLGMVSVMAESFLAVLNEIAKALRAEMKDAPNEARRLSVLYAQLGMLSPRLESVHATAQLLLQESAPPRAPVAKWFTLAEHEGRVQIRAYASPILPGSTLRNQLWAGVRAAVVTSATLTSCGEFDFFLRETGLKHDDATTTLEVASPFDYASQGQFVTVQTLADPRNASAFTSEMVLALVRDLADVEHGALCLFTSRDQMRQAVLALSAALKPLVLVQGDLPRIRLMQQHRERVQAGEVSIIFGMQSFGEGLDLPGLLCETVFIAKLPFASPDDPVGESRAEWLRGVGRDPFSELVVPATAVKLAQWAGRAIRTETDKSFVYCYDKRLSDTSYGQRLLQGLPPFARKRKDAQGRVLA
ncbi:ATP-dependent DNA helicase DinG [Rhodoferax sp.]|uniref:ATP-dependent DNA helicase DinG n=1 Tax=Rhodoferax sp. TaxID=50421 RepID=UPI00374CC043